MRTRCITGSPYTGSAIYRLAVCGRCLYAAAVWGLAVHGPAVYGPLFARVSLHTGPAIYGPRHIRARCRRASYMRVRAPLRAASMRARRIRVRYTGALYTGPALYGLPRHGVGVDRRFGQVCPAQQIVELLGGVIARKEQLLSIRLLLHLSRQLNHSPNCLSTRWKVGMTAPPVVYSAQKLL